MSAPRTFTKLEEPSVLLPIFKSRHPHSCFILNQLVRYKGYSGAVTFYFVGDELGPDTWIVSVNMRRDYGPQVSISAPTAVVQGQQDIEPDIKNTFAAGGNVIDWDNSMTFVALEKKVSKMIMEISVDLKGHVSEMHPCNLYYMEIEDALNLQIKSPSSSIECRRLNADSPEEVDFIVSGWKYSGPGTTQEIGDNIKVFASGGVFVEQKCVAGVYCAGYGLLSALYTSKDERGKGYGKLAMSFGIQQCAQDSCVPCCTVEQRNTRSIKFHEAVEMKLMAIVDWIEVKKLEVD